MPAVILTLTSHFAQMAIDQMAKQEVHENIFEPGNACQCDECGAYRTALAALLLARATMAPTQSITMHANPPNVMRIKGKSLVIPIKH